MDNNILWEDDGQLASQEIFVLSWIRNSLQCSHSPPIQPIIARLNEMQQILSQKLEKEKFDGYDMRNECQKKQNSEECV